MPVHRYAPITVVGRPIRTFIEVRRGDLVEIHATGTVNFGGSFLGLGAPVLGPDGDNWSTPPDYPAPGLSKNSLIIGIRSATYPYSTLWFQGGANRSFSSPVDGFLTLAANDGLPDDNTGGWSVTVIITTPERYGSSSVRLGIGHVEFVQSMQRTDNSVPLVGGKRTLVRTFVHSGRSDPAPVPITGTLEVQRPDGSIVNISPSAPGLAVREGIHDRNNIASSLNFILPSTPVGMVRFRIRVFVPGRVTDTGYSVEERTTATFVNAPVISIRPFLIALPASGVGAPTAVAAMMVLTEALQRLPVANGRGILPLTTHSYSLPFGDESSWRNLLNTVAGVLSEPGVGRIGEPGERDFIQVAFILSLPNAPMAGIAMGRPWLPVASAVCSIGSNADFDADACAHEIGHTLGLLHAPCNDPPIPLDSHLPRLAEEPGWYAARNRMVPAGTSEMMGYCDPRWPSIPSYEYILNGHWD